jgi:hypothetical protein
VLLPSDKYRKPITPITSVLLPFVTYLLTLLVYRPKCNFPLPVAFSYRGPNREHPRTLWNLQSVLIYVYGCCCHDTQTWKYSFRMRFKSSFPSLLLITLINYQFLIREISVSLEFQLLHVVILTRQEVVCLAPISIN